MTKARAGRPSLYTPQLGAEICVRIASGLSVAAVCAGEDMPTPSTLFLWLSRHDDFKAIYQAAQRARTFAIAEEIIAIADTPQMGEKQTIKADGKVEVAIADMTTHRKMQIDARRWLLARMNPRDFGDKVAHVGGSPDDAPVAVTLIERHIVRPEDRDR